MARRWLLVGLVGGACTSTQPVPGDRLDPGEAEPEPPAREQPVREVRHDPERGMQLAAASDGALRISVMADGGLAVHGDGVIAFAPAGAGPLRSDTKWLRGLPRDGLVPMRAVGGRWPDQAYVSAVAEWGRSALIYATWRWQDGAWTRLSLAKAHPLNDFYSDYAAGPDGAVLGLRGFLVDSNIGDADSTPRVLQVDRPELRTTIDRLDGGPPPPWPPLPPGHEAVDLLAFADGSMVVLRTEPSLHRWTPGASEWVELPGLPEHGDGKAISPHRAGVVGRDPDRLYAHQCTHDGVAALDRLSGGEWRSEALPEGSCVRSLAEAPDGTLWLVNDRGLHRRRAGARWEAVALPPVDVPMKPVAALSADVELPPPGPEPVFAHQVVALDRGELWVAASVGTPLGRGGPVKRGVVLTTRTVIAPLVLRPLDLAQEPGPATE